MPSVIRPSSLQRPLGGPASWSGGPHGQIPLGQAGPLCYSHAFGLPAALMHQGSIPTSLQSHPPVHPAAQEMSWWLREWEQLAKPASSSRLMAKELAP